MNLNLILYLWGCFGVAAMGCDVFYVKKNRKTFNYQAVQLFTGEIALKNIKKIEYESRRSTRLAMGRRG